jgi:ParB family transcriptional regulator, chromosome partitioning protein
LMSKQDELKRNFGGNIAASMGQTPLRGVSPTLGAAPVLTVTRRNDVVTVPVELVISDPDQPREEFGEEELDQLAASIAEQGQLQTVVVYKEGERYMLVCGERRWRAVKRKGLPTINATLLKEKPDEMTRLILQHQENRQRKAFTRNEEAKVFRTLMERFGMSRAEVARKLVITEADVSRALAIEAKLPEDVKEKVTSGVIAPAVAYEITKVGGADRQRELAEMAEHGASRADIIEAAKGFRDVAPRKRAGRRKVDSPSHSHLEYKAGGITVTLTGSGLAEGAEVIAAALDEVKARVLAEAHDNARDYAA